MRFKRSIALIIGATCAAALFAWSHAQSRSVKAVILDAGQDANDTNILTLAGTIGPMITAPIMGRDLDPMVSLGTLVRRGDVIGTGESPTAPVELERARQELRAARAAMREAGAAVRALEEAADTMGANLLASADMGLAPATAQTVITELRAATARRNAAEAALEQMQRGFQSGLIVAPADGVIVAFEQAQGTSFGIASDPQQLLAYAMVRPADLMDIRVGEASLIVLDKEPSVTFHGHVSAISDTSIDLPEGAFYCVTFTVEDHAGAWFSSLAMRARVPRPGK